MKKRIIPIFLVLCIFTSCAPEQPEQDDSVLVPMEVNTDILEAKKSHCVMDSDAPVLSYIPSPVDPEVLITFSWTIDCIPNEYSLVVSKFKDEQSQIYNNFFTTEETSLTLDLNLEPATSYQWELKAIVDGFNLENAYADGGVFKTGPLCTAEELVAPTLVLPEDGTIDTGKGWGNQQEVHTTIKYPAGECVPKYFDIWFSLSPNFEEGDNLNPYGPNFGEKVGEWLFFEDDSSATQNCNLYYWRARAAAENGFGDWSETFTFYLDVYGNCYKFPELKALVNANCRKDPWAGENYVSIVWEGDNAELLGLNETGDWGMFKLQNELECWVNMSMMEPDPPDAVFFPGFYPVLEHGEPPEDLPAPAPADEPSGGEAQEGCIVINDTGNPVCVIPCPQRSSTARKCP